MKKKLIDHRTLFLDRDGVINHRLAGRYVSSVAEFEFQDGAVEAIRQFTEQFDYILIVTNQAGIGKGLMTTEDLNKVHGHLLTEVEKVGGQIDAVYHCPERKETNPECRKPNTGMAHQAQHDFPDIDFKSSIMVGDSISDMEFGKRLGMTTVLIEGKEEEAEELTNMDINYRFSSLKGLAAYLDKELDYTGRP